MFLVFKFSKKLHCHALLEQFTHLFQQFTHLKITDLPKCIFLARPKYCIYTPYLNFYEKLHR